MQQRIFILIVNVGIMYGGGCVCMYVRVSLSEEAVLANKVLQFAEGARVACFVCRCIRITSARTTSQVGPSPQTFIRVSRTILPLMPAFFFVLGPACPLKMHPLPLAALLTAHFVPYVLYFIFTNFDITNNVNRGIGKSTILFSF